MKMIKHTLNIGLGTAAIGRPQYINLRLEAADDFSLRAFKKHGRLMLNEAYRKGIRYFDTAPGYGLAEQFLIDWIQEKGYKDVEIATKWGYTYVANFNPEAIIHEVKEHSITRLNLQWEQSKNLLPYLSSYQIHSATLESGVFENQQVLNRLGELKAKHGLLIGLTTSGPNQAAVIQKSLEIKVGDEALFDVYQVTYNLLDQSLFHIGKLLLTKEKRIVVKEALANGRIFPNSNYQHYANLYQQLEILGAKYEVGIDAIAFRFCMDIINPFMVLSGASNEGQITENLKANQFKLEEKELSKLQEFSVDPEQYWQERKQLKWN
jgi:aryl-alcohol dehydrogenase-like predicted oxidoreductase